MEKTNSASERMAPHLPNKFGFLREFFGDKRFFAGTFLGVSLLAGGYAVSASDNYVSYSDPTSVLLSEQESVTSEKLKQDAIDCANGSQEGSIKYAIDMSLKAHLEMASASPNVEQLFDVNSDCFSGLSSLIDLSFAIPSLASIIAAAQDAVLAYAKKKICSAVSNVTGMVTGPINQAIGQANGYIGALNGLSANLNSGGGMAMIDPNLGSNYNIGTSGTYTTGQPFGDRTSPAPGDSTGGGNSSSNYAQVQTLTEQLGRLQASLGPAQYAVEQARQALETCERSGQTSCASQASAIQAAEQNLRNIQTQISSIQSQISTLLGSNISSKGTQAAQTGSTWNPAGTTQSPKQTNQTLTQQLSNMFQ